MHTLSRILRLDTFGDYQTPRPSSQTDAPLLCEELFAELMNEDSLPKRIRVTVSTRSIRDAARVSVYIDEFAEGIWLNWHSRPKMEGLYPAAVKYLRQIGVPQKTWTDIWVDWEPV